MLTCTANPGYISGHLGAGEYLRSNLEIFNNH